MVAANEEIQRYAYIVSHDLRAPLVNIMGFTSELDAARRDIERFRAEAIAAVPALEKSDAMRAIDTDLGESIDFIRTSTQKMDRLINAILKISREGSRVLTPEPVDMTVLAEDVAKTVAHQLAEAGGTMTVQPLPPVVSDRLALEQVFGNLVGNAVKYLTPGVPPVIVVAAEERGADIEYTVSDNGRGVRPARSRADIRPVSPRRQARQARRGDLGLRMYGRLCDGSAATSPSEASSARGRRSSSPSRAALKVEGRPS